MSSPVPTLLNASKNFTSNPNLTGGVDENGNPVNSSIAKGFLYSTCIPQCGSSLTSSSISVFSQAFNSWLLPWLALVSALPFGAKRYSGNLMAVLLAVGSPALAIYSWSLTILNGHWLKKRTEGITYPNADHAFHVFNSLQQAPLKLEPSQYLDCESKASTDDIEAYPKTNHIESANRYPLLKSLIVLPNNDAWWKDFRERLNFVHTWSIASLTSLFWVLFAYLLTVANSYFVPSDDGPYSSILVGVDGQGVGALWLWLLPLVFGWLRVAPKCDYICIEKAF